MHAGDKVDDRTGAKLRKKRVSKGGVLKAEGDRGGCQRLGRGRVRSQCFLGVEFRSGTVTRAMRTEGSDGHTPCESV